MKCSKLVGFFLGVILVASLTFLAEAQFGSPQTWREFTVIRTERSVTWPIQTDVSSVRFEAHRRDGSVSTGPTLQAGPLGGTRSVILRSEGVDALLDDVTQSKRTLYIPKLTPFTASAIDPSCGFSKITPLVKPELLGEEEVLGFRTLIIRTHEGPFLHTDWKAPDLDCAVIKMTEDRSDDSGQVNGRFELLATQILLGPPDPKLFEIPSSYAEKLPSEFDEARRKYFGFAPPSRATLQSLQEKDASYARNHSTKGAVPAR